MNRIKRTMLDIALVLLAILIVLGIYRIYSTIRDYKKGEELYAETAGVIVTGRDEVPSEEETAYRAPVTVDFPELLQENKDTVAWLYQEDSTINYPVVQRDNSYYLTHLFDGSENPSGTLFLDEHNSADITDYNTILYGHNMKDGSMFAALENYKRDPDYIREHPSFWLLTPDRDYKVTIISAYTAEADDEAYTVFTGPTEEYEDWIKKVLQKSEIETGESATATDRCITLSTCDYSRDNGRYVVIGKIEE